MKKILLGALTLVVVLGITGCKNMKGRDIGTVAGAGAGALIGSQIGGGSGNVLATVGGAAAGGLAGHYVGKSMEKK